MKMKREDDHVFVHASIFNDLEDYYTVTQILNQSGSMVFSTTKTDGSFMVIYRMTDEDYIVDLASYLM